MKFYKLCFLSFFMSVGFCYAQNTPIYNGDGGANKKILVGKSIIENGKSDKTDIYLTKNIKESVINDILNYSKVQPISTDDRELIKMLQKESEEVNFEENSEIELGKLINANLVVQLKITKQPDANNYTASFSLTNITTGAREGGGDIGEYYNESNFLQFAHGYLSVYILKALGVKLTPAGERFIIGKALGSNVADSIKDAEEDELLIAEMLKKAQAELRMIDVTKLTSAEAEAKKIQQKQQIILLEQRKKQAEEKRLRMAEDERRRKEDEEKRAHLSEKQKNKLLETSKKIEQKAALLRKQKLQYMSAYEKITVIENEKRTLLEMNNEIIDNIDSANEQYDRYYRNKRRELQEEYAFGGQHDIYYVNGELSETGQMVVKEKLQRLKNDNDKLKADKEAEIKKENAQPLKILKNKITKDLKDLEKTVNTSSSISDSNLYFRVTNYDFALNGWNYTLVFGFDGQEVFKYDGNISYKTVTKKKPVILSEDKTNLEQFEKFVDHVQEIDSYFRLNLGYIIADIKYNVCTKNVEDYSQYEIVLDELSFKSFETGKVIETIPLSHTYDYQYNPITVIDWRTDSLVKKDDIEAKKKQQIELIEQKKEEANRIALEEKKARQEELLKKENEKNIRKENSRKEKEEKKLKYKKKLDSKTGVFCHLTAQGLAGHMIAGGTGLGLYSLKNGIGYGVDLICVNDIHTSYPDIFVANGELVCGFYSLGIAYGYNVVNQHDFLFGSGLVIPYENFVFKVKVFMNKDKDGCVSVGIGLRL